MTLSDKLALSSLIIEKAKSLGASLVGITDISTLFDSPSHKNYDFQLLAEVKSVIVLALAHKETEPRLDWWDGAGTAGNTRLESIAKNLKRFIKEELNTYSRLLPYHPGGGLFLKDAAVLAGLGIIGANNLVITPEFGPRIRLRVLGVSSSLTITGSKDFDPCATCHMPCRQACPQNAFRDGFYNRALCMIQMKIDEARENNIIEVNGQLDPPARYIRYCRACEFACPVGKDA
ncbi:MAG: epoxyqueuosine reductase [Candidatus Hermodarchaeota archaeon]